MSLKSYSVLIKKKINDFNKIAKVDSDKSISIRSFLIGSISNDVSKIKNPLISEDVLSCINCLRKLGVKIEKKNKNNYLVYGKGLGSLNAKKNFVLNCGNSGTLARLLIGILSTTPNIKAKIEGDKSLNKRSMHNLILAMNEFGAEFHPKNKSRFPLTLTSSDMPVGTQFISGKSAQIKSAIILAGLNSFGNTTIYEKLKTRDHTEKILLNNSKSIKILKTKKIIKIFGRKRMDRIVIDVPADPSSAAFFAAMCLLNKNSKLTIKNVCLNPRRMGFYTLLKKHGGKIKIKKSKKKNNEIVGDIEVLSSRVRPINGKPQYYLSATDEYPIMFVIAALIRGTSKFQGIEDLANKESNRILEMKKVLKKIGIVCKTNKDSIKIFGKGIIKKNNNIIKVDSKNDHRIAMSCAILSLVTGIKFLIKGFETVKTSSPSFLRILNDLGGNFEIKKTS